MSSNITSGFSFGDESVARFYDEDLVPVLFRPWAEALIESHGPWGGRRVLDLATGTGILTRLLARQVGKSGSVVGMDLNSEMLAVAAASIEDDSPNVNFIECRAENLDSPDDSFDYVICQQGFQFFSAKNEAAGEIRRVLREDGSVVVSVWRKVSECQFFNTVCETLGSIGEEAIAGLMRTPFDSQSQSELEETFRSAGFKQVNVHREERDMIMQSGVEQAIKAAYATPIGPKLRSLSEETQARFREVFTKKIGELAADKITMGKMASDILVARN